MSKSRRHSNCAFRGCQWNKYIGYCLPASNPIALLYKILRHLVNMNYADDSSCIWMDDAPLSVCLFAEKNLLIKAKIVVTRKIFRVEGTYFETTGGYYSELPPQHKKSITKNRFVFFTPQFLLISLHSVNSVNLSKSKS